MKKMSFVYDNGKTSFYTDQGIESILVHIKEIIQEDEIWTIKTSCPCKQHNDDCPPCQFILSLTIDNFIDPLLVT